VGEPSKAAVVPACLFAWLLPGAGHFYLGRRGRGLLFFVGIVTLFVLGVAMNARLQMTPGLEDPVGFVISVAQVATGVPYFMARALGFDLGQVKSVTFEYGMTFTGVAGLLNVLAILDAHDIAVGRKT
jgi:hypothetical protein